DARVRGGGRDDHRGARRGLRQAGVHGARVQRRGARGDVRRAAGLRSARPSEPRQGLPRPGLPRVGRAGDAVRAGRSRGGGTRRGGSGRGDRGMIERLRGIVGDAGVRTGEAAARWAVHGAIPAAVVVPGSVEEAAAVLALASAEGWRIEPAGAGTWLGWGRPPERVDVALSAERLAAVEVYEPADLTAVVGAGATLRGLDDTFGRHGQWLPLDPPGGGAGTIGAAVSLAEAGPLRLAHGTPRDHVLGLTLVTGDGRVLELGGRVVKNVAGFDLIKLATGARGTLGLICRVAVRLRPLPERDATLVLTAAGPDAALDVAAAIRDARVEPAALEL